MRIWVDADACPNAIKEILFRAAERARIDLTLVANQPVRTPPSQYIKALQVPPGFDVADNKIVELTEAGDLVITADIPLAAGVIDKGGHALDPRGESYTKDNIKERLAMRKLMDEPGHIARISRRPNREVDSRWNGSSDATRAQERILSAANR